MIILKYTKNVDYFIVNIFYFIELYVKNQLSEKITLYTSEPIYCILTSAFDNNKIIVQKISQLRTNVFLATIDELETYLSKLYNMSIIGRPSKPIFKNTFQHMSSVPFICVYPKFKPTEKYNNITNDMLNNMLTNKNLAKIKKYIIGDISDKLNVHIGTDITNYYDTFSLLKYCKLCIVSESMWHYISLLCGCKNIIVYYSDIEPQYEYNPFCSNIYYTNDLTSKKITDIINNILG